MSVRKAMVKLKGARGDAPCQLLLRMDCYFAQDHSCALLTVCGFCIPRIEGLAPCWNSGWQDRSNCCPISSRLLPLGFSDSKPQEAAPQSAAILWQGCRHNSSRAQAVTQAPRPLPAPPAAAFALARAATARPLPPTPVATFFACSTALRAVICCITLLFLSRLQQDWPHLHSPRGFARPWC